MYQRNETMGKNQPISFKGCVNICGMCVASPVYIRVTSGVCIFHNFPLVKRETQCVRPGPQLGSVSLACCSQQHQTDLVQLRHWLIAHQLF